MNAAVPAAREAQSFRTQRRRARRLALGVCGACGALVLLAWNGMRHAEQRELHQRLDLEADHYVHALRDDLLSKASMVRGAAGLFEASELVTAQEWAAYVERVGALAGEPGVVSLGRSRRQTDSLAGPGYSITHIAPDNDANQRLMARGPVFDAALLAGIARAMRSGEIAILAADGALESATPAARALMIEPMFRSNPAAVESFVFLELDPVALAQAAAHDLGRQQRVRVVDRRRPGVLYESEAPASEPASGAVTTTRELADFGLDWVLEFSRLPAPAAGVAGSTILLGSGSLAGLLLGLLTEHLATARLRAELAAQRITRELRRALARFEAVVENTPLVAICSVDRSGTVGMWNPASAALFGIAREQAVGRPLAELLFTGDARDEFRRSLEHVFDTAASSGLAEWSYEMPGGRPISVYSTMFPIVVGGEVREVFLMDVDISARKTAERELARHRDHLRELVEEHTREARAARDEAQRANRVKSEFLANMSHELRTPMHAILSFARLGEARARNETPGKLLEYFERVRTSGERLLALLDDLLDLSKLESGKVELDLREHSVLDLVADAVVEFEAMFQAKGVALRVCNADSVDKLLLDRSRIGQVVRNLLSNAAKFTPSGRGVEVRLQKGRFAFGRRATDAGSLADGVEIVVSDEGIGIPEAELERVFDKFVQSSKTRTGAGGTGLGLAISREIVEAHGGCIFAQSNSKGGADFFVRLPIRAVGASDPGSTGWRKA